MKKYLIYMVCFVAMIAMVTSILMLSFSGTTTSELYWGVSCEAEDTCNLKITGIAESIYDVEPPVENGTESTYTKKEEYVDAGIISASAQWDNLDDIPWKKYHNKVTTVSLGGEDDTLVPSTMYGWFYGMENLEDIDLQYINSSISSSFDYLFYNCKSLRNLDLNLLNTHTSGTITANNKTLDYTYLETINMPVTGGDIFIGYGKWYKGTETSNTFYGKDSTCWNTLVTNATPKYYWAITDGVLTISASSIEGTITGWNYEGAKTNWFDPYTGELVAPITSVEVEGSYSPIIMDSLFANLKEVTSIDLTGLNTSNTVDMNNLFKNCKKLQSLDLSNLSTESIIAEIDISNPSNLFTNCISLKEVKIGSEWKYTLSEGTWINKDDESDKFYGGVINTEDDVTYIRESIFWGVNADKTKLIISNSYVDAKYNGSFDYLESGPYETIDPSFTIPWGEYKNTVTSIEIGSSDNKITPKYMNSWFSEFSKVKTLDLSNINTSELVEMDSTFYGMSSLKTLDLSNINLSGVNLLTSTFQGCSNLETLNISTVVGNEIYMETPGGNIPIVLEMLTGCNKLKKLNISSLKLENDEELLMYYYLLFQDLSNLSEITIGETNVDVIKQILSNPSSDCEENAGVNSSCVEGAEGKWYDSNSNGYDADSLPSAGTYYAVKPRKVSYDGANTTAYSYGETITVSGSGTKNPLVETVTTTFVSDSETINSITSNKTTTYKLTGFTYKDTEYKIGDAYTVKEDTNFISKFVDDEVTYESIVLPDAPEKIGFIFKGWSQTNDDTSGLAVGSNYTPNGNKTFYATWEKITYKFEEEENTTLKYKKGKTTSLVLTINGELNKFNKLYITDGTNPHEFTKNTDYTLTSGSTIITFTEVGMNYLASLTPGAYTIGANYSDSVDDVTTNFVVEDEDKIYVLTVQYKYSGSRSEEKVFDDYTNGVVENTTYNVDVPTKDGYTSDITSITGTMPSEDKTILVTYTPNNDNNSNDIADEEDSYYTVKFVVSGSGTLKGKTEYTNILTGLTLGDASVVVPTVSANKYYEFVKWDVEPKETNVVDKDITYVATFAPKNDENQNGIADELEKTTDTDTNSTKTKEEVKSPKTKDSFITYLVLEIISLITGVYVFIKIKAQ